MATVKKSAPAKKVTPAKKVAAAKKTAVKNPAAKKPANPDIALIKAMIAGLAANATANLAKPAKVGAIGVNASRWLSTYALRHAEHLEALEATERKFTDTSAERAAARKVVNSLRKFEELHNFLICQPVSTAFRAKRAKAKTDAAYARLNAAETAAKIEALAAQGIGARQLPKD